MKKYAIAKRNLFFYFCLFFFNSCNDTTKPDINADIGLYSDNGVWDKSVTAAKNMFEWMEKTVALIDAEYINDNSLNGFRIVVFPGGDMYQYSQDISQKGINKIRSFINNGGGYIGLCGGAYFTAEKIIWQGTQLPMMSLNLFSGSAEGTIDAIIPYPQRGMCQVIITDTSHFITKNISSPQWMMYYWGPVFKPTSSEVTILGKYQSVNQAAMLAFKYGNGRVFIIGTHPEIEEDSNRDSVVFVDTVINGTTYLGEDILYDQGSDWDLMLNATKWCLRNSL